MVDEGYCCSPSQSNFTLFSLAMDPHTYEGSFCLIEAYLGLVDEPLKQLRCVLIFYPVCSFTRKLPGRFFLV